MQPMALGFLSNPDVRFFFFTEDVPSNVKSSKGTRWEIRPLPVKLLRQGRPFAEFRRSNVPFESIMRVVR